MQLSERTQHLGLQTAISTKLIFRITYNRTVIKLFGYALNNLQNPEYLSTTGHHTQLSAFILFLYTHHFYQRTILCYLFINYRGNAKWFIIPDTVTYQLLISWFKNV